MRTEDADHHRARGMVLEHGQDEFGVDLGTVGPLDHRGEAPAQQLGRPGAHEVLEAVGDWPGHGVGHDVERGATDERTRRPAHQLLGCLVDVADLTQLIGGHHGVA